MPKGMVGTARRVATHLADLKLQICKLINMKVRNAILLVLITMFNVQLAWAGSEEDVVKAVQQNQPWQAQKYKCPADIAPKERGLFKKNEERVDPEAIDKLKHYYQQCSGENKGYACYNLALGLESLNYDHESDVVFQEACRLGVPSGCTNRAAAMLNKNPDNEKMTVCTAKSFAKACEWKDPWGCTMYADQLTTGNGVSKNNGLALEVMRDSCLYGEDDPACSTAKRLEQMIKGEAMQVDFK